MNTLDKAIYDYHNTDKTITTILTENKITKSFFYRHLDYVEPWRTKHKQRKYTYDLEAFKKDSQEKYYWLGFISADGSIVKNSLNIELKDLDEGHLNKFNKFCNNTKPLLRRINNKGCSCVRAIINSSELVQYLANYNIVPNKSLIFTIPNNIPSEYILDFVRGLIDGDGCIKINNHQQINLTFCSGNKICVDQVKNILHCDNKTVFSGNVWSFQVTGNKKAKAILDKLYENSTEKTRLDRKYNIYKTLD